MPKQAHLPTTGIDFGLGMLIKPRGTKIMRGLRSSRRDPVYAPGEEEMKEFAAKMGAERDALDARQWRLWFQRMKLEADRRDVAASGSREERTLKAANEEKERIRATLKLAESKLISKTEETADRRGVPKTALTVATAAASAAAADASDDDSSDDRETRGERRRAQKNEKEMVKAIRRAANETHIIDSTLVEEAQIRAAAEYKTQIKELRSIQRRSAASVNRWSYEARIKELEQKQLRLKHEKANPPEAKGYLTRPNPNDPTPKPGSMLLRTAMVGALDGGSSLVGDQKITNRATAVLLSATGTATPQPAIEAPRNRRHWTNPLSLRNWSAAGDPAATSQPKLPRRWSASDRILTYQKSRDPNASEYQSDGSNLVWYAPNLVRTGPTRDQTYRATNASGILAEEKVAVDKHHPPVNPPPAYHGRRNRKMRRGRRRDVLERHLQAVSLRARQFQLSANKRLPARSDRANLHGREKRVAKKTASDATSKETKELAAQIAQNRVVSAVMNIGSARVVSNKSVMKARDRELSTARAALRNRKAFGLNRPETILGDSQIDPYESDLEEMDRGMIEFDDKFERAIRAGYDSDTALRFARGEFVLSDDGGAPSPAESDDTDIKTAPVTAGVAVAIRKPKDTGCGASEGKRWAAPPATAPVAVSVAAAESEWDGDDNGGDDDDGEGQEHETDQADAGDDGDNGDEGEGDPSPVDDRDEPNWNGGEDDGGGGADD